jgi:hypothetical protein
VRILILTSQEGFDDIRINVDNLIAYYPDRSGGANVLVGHEDTIFLVHESCEEIDAAINDGVGIITRVGTPH